MCGVECEKLVQGQTLNVGIRRAGRDFRSKKDGQSGGVGGCWPLYRSSSGNLRQESAGIAAVAPGFHSFSAVSSATLARGCTQSGAAARPGYVGRFLMGMNSIGIIPGHVLNLHAAPLLPAMYRYFHACLFFPPSGPATTKQAPNSSSSSQPTSQPSQRTNQPTAFLPLTRSRV